MRTKVTFAELAEFLDVPASFVADISSISVWDGEPTIEIEHFVKNESGQKVLNNRGESMKNTIRIALVK